MRRYGTLVLSSLTLAGILTGCASPAVMIASQMVDGVSYLATGKSTSDHALSRALDEDCALHRLIEGAAVCKEKSRDPSGDIQTASLVGAPLSLPDAAFEKLTEDPAENPIGDREGVEEIPLGRATDVRLGKQISPGTDHVVRASGQPVPASRGFGADMFFVPDHAGDADDRAKNKNLSADTAVLPALDLDKVGPESDIAAAPPADVPFHPSAGKPAKRFFIVLGSFSTRSNAQLAAGQMPHSVRPVMASYSGPQIAVADVRGRTFYRIVLGPLDRPTSLQARRQFVAAGLGNTWTVAACRGGTSAGCIAGH